MGRSHTIVCIGETEQNENGEAELFFANSSLEVLQIIKKHPEVKYWTAQTKVGQTILKLGIYEFEYVRTSEDFVKNCKIKTIPCVCKNGCFICNYSGITTKKHLKGFQDWQIERAKNGD